MPFGPKLHEQIKIGGRAYKFDRHPGAGTDILYAQEGRRGKVYRLIAADRDEAYALKRFKASFQNPAQAATAAHLASFARIEGLEALHRVVVTEETDPELFRELKELKYAVIMPWIEGSTWADMLLELRENKKTLGVRKAHELTACFLRVMTMLEAQNLAHTDIASGNVVLNVTSHRVHLVDLEELYAPGLPEPKFKNVGTEGYAHRSIDPEVGIWSPVADRFATAVLAAEILAASSAELVAQFAEDHLFPPQELQDPSSPRFQLLHAHLGERWPAFADAFNRAWAGKSLAECPLIAELCRALGEPPQIVYRIDAFVDRGLELSSDTLSNAHLSLATKDVEDIQVRPVASEALYWWVLHLLAWALLVWLAFGGGTPVGLLRVVLMLPIGAITVLTCVVARRRRYACVLKVRGGRELVSLYESQDASEVEQLEASVRELLGVYRGIDR